MSSPKEILKPYQLKFVNDRSRFKIGLFSRQTGKSFCTAAETVEDCIRRKTTWVTLSRGERQALEWMDKAKQWSEAYEFAIADIIEERDSPEALIRSAEIIWPNGSRAIAIPANPDTARGYTANVNLDEFAFHEKPDDIWRAMYPSISNPLKGELMLRVASTPNGKGNKFYDLWTKNEKFSKHFVDIYTAAPELGIDVAALKEGLDDPEGWAQEYECQFIDASSVLFPYDVISSCESEDAIAAWTLNALKSDNPIYLGGDVGRKKDLSVIWALEEIGDVLWTKGVLVMEKMPFREQREIWSRALAMDSVKNACIDATGIGAMLAEELSRDFYGKVVECVYTAKFKAEIFNGLRRKFDDKTIRVPVDRSVREDLHAIQKITSAGGNIRYVAPHSEDGHSDRANALALAVKASKQEVMPLTCSIPGASSGPAPGEISTPQNDPFFGCY